jgi:hypothetical protein
MPDITQELLKRNLYEVFGERNAMRRRERIAELWNLVPNYETTNSKCFVWCRLGTSKPTFLSLRCTEVVPRKSTITQLFVRNTLVFKDDRCPSRIPGR